MTSNEINSTKEALSARMRRIRKTDTKPEMVVRQLAHRMGFRYRLHRRDLPGTPDLVFPSLRKVIFVHGCFWHQHDCRLGAKQPSANPGYWLPKLARNVERDYQARTKLAKEGWDVLVIWECQTRAPDHLPALITGLLYSRLPRES
jgi:DNA mismatch endonuclease (patch repair protein)